jgi:spore coat polysaccharide biosynthesis protein SpsF
LNLGKVGVVVAARTASTRLPGKALLPLGGKPMILFLLERLRSLRSAELVVASTLLESDNELVATVEGAGIPVFRGNAQDLVQRYCDVAEHFGFDTIVRITADCPFIDVDMVEWCLARAAEKESWDLATTKGRFPVGLDAEIYPAALMQKLNESTLSDEEREHLTLHLYRHDYAIALINPPAEWPSVSQSFTVDTREDYQNAEGIVDYFQSGDFGLKELLLR